MDGHRNCLVIDDDKIVLKLAATCCIEQADQAMYEHKALRSDGVSGLTNHRSMHGV